MNVVFMVRWASKKSGVWGHQGWVASGKIMTRKLKYIVSCFFGVKVSVLFPIPQSIFYGLWVAVLNLCAGGNPTRKARYLEI